MNNELIEKAKIEANELFEKFMQFDPMIGLSYIYSAKECAKICVNEKIELLKQVHQEIDDKLNKLQLELSKETGYNIKLNANYNNNIEYQQELLKQIDLI